MSELNKLRNSLREHYDTREVPYEEREWERASALLHSKRRRRKIGYTALVLIFGISTLIIATYNWHPDSQIVQQVSVNSNEEKTPPVNINKDPSPARNPEVTEKAGNFSNKIKRSLPNTGNSSITESREEITVSVSVSKKPVQAAESKAVKETPGVVEGSKSADEIQIEENDIARTENKIGNNNPEGNQVVNATEKVVPAPAVQSNSQADILPAGELNQEPQKKEVVHSDTTGSALALASPGTNEIEKMDSLSPKIISGPGEGIFYEAGAAWFAGWKGADTRDATGFSPVAGINYLNRLSNRYSISFGIQYYMVPDLVNSSKTSRISSYKYGELSAVTVITPRTLHYLCAPLRFHLELDPKNAIGAGINMAYLINVDATVENYDEKPGKKENYETMKLSGYTEGFSWYDSQVAVFYRRQLGNSFGIQAEVFAGLTDVKNNEFFGADLKEKNSGAKLTLIYFAFRKNRIK